MILPVFPVEQSKEERIVLIREAVDAKRHSVAELEAEISALCAGLDQSLRLGRLSLEDNIGRALAEPLRPIVCYTLKPTAGRLFVYGLLADLLEANDILKRQVIEFPNDLQSALKNNHQEAMLRVLALGAWLPQVQAVPGNRLGIIGIGPDWHFQIGGRTIWLNVELLFHNNDARWQQQFLVNDAATLRDTARFSSAPAGALRVMHYILGTEPSDELGQALAKLAGTGSVDAIILHLMYGAGVMIFGREAPTVEPWIGQGRKFGRPPVAPIPVFEEPNGSSPFPAMSEAQRAQFQEAIEARKPEVRWNRLPKRNVGTMRLLSEQVQAMAEKDLEMLPSFDSAEPLLLFSDYSGSHAGAHIDAYSFLLTQPAAVRDWEPVRLAVRAKLGLARRRLAFKGLKDEVKARALGAWLRMFDPVPGLLVTILIEKTVGTSELASQCEQLRTEQAAYAKIKPAVLERLLRISHLLSVFVAGLSVPGQNLLWITDEDEIAANDARMRPLTDIFARVCSVYVNHGLGHLRCGTTRLDNGSLDTEDLASLPDLVAGALAELLTRQAQSGLQPPVGWVVPPPPALSAKTQRVLEWMANTRLPLRRLAFSISETPDGTLTVRKLEHVPVFPPAL